MCGGADPVEVTDADLVRRAATGDKESFGEVFERYHDVVYRFARRDDRFLVKLPKMSPRKSSSC